MATKGSKEMNHSLLHSGLTGYRSFYWGVRVFAIVVLLACVINITIGKKAKYDRKEIVAQIFFDNKQTINRLKHEGFSRISIVYFPCDFINFFKENWLYDIAYDESYRDLIIKYSEQKHIENISEYINKKGIEQFNDELDSWQSGNDLMYYYNSIAMRGYEKFLSMTEFVYQFFAILISVYIVCLYDRKFPRKYAICPYKECRKSVLVYGRWICKYCDNKQPKDKFVYEKCTYCGRLNNTETCEGCGGEFYI